MPFPAIVTKTIFIVVVEDNPGDVLLIREALNESGLTHEIKVLNDGVEAIDYLTETVSGDGARPDLIILDLNMPRLDGAAVVDFVMGMPALSDTPVVVLSSSESPRDRKTAEAIQHGLYIVKPSDLNAFLDIGNRIRAFLEAQPERQRSFHAN